MQNTYLRYYFRFHLQDWDESVPLVGGWRVKEAPLFDRLGQPTFFYLKNNRDE